MNAKHARKLIVLLLAAGVSATVARAQSAPTTAGMGAIGKVITTWNSDCSGNNLSWWDDMVDGWYDEITSTSHHGSEAWWRDGFYVNGYHVDSDYCDPTKVTWGDDDGVDEVDEADAIMIGLHGGEYGTYDQWFARVRVDESGSGNCDAKQEDMLWGDFDLEFAHLSSCHSMDWDVRYCGTGCTSGCCGWSDTFDRLHQIFGFHGCMWIGSSWPARYEDFADDAFYMPIGTAWIDNLYVTGIGSNNVDSCPMVRGTGSDVDDLWDRVFHEQYDWVYPDPVSTRHGVVYIGDCDPACDPALP